jgi:hypothetical protein
MAISGGLVSSVAIVLVAGCFPPYAHPQSLPAASTASDLPRVRTGNARLASLISEARERSHTFSTLIASIDATDGIVFIEEGRCRRSAPACLTWHVTLAGPYRMLFVRLDPRKSDLDLMASAGHELQHALEVLADVSLRSTAAIQFSYMHGLTWGSLRSPETAAAEATGNAVFLEVQRSRSAGKKR